MFKKPKARSLALSAIVLSCLSLLTQTGVCARSEKSIREQVVQLVSAHGSCTGEQIKARSGKSYILTAAHCGVLAQDGSIEAVNAEGAHIKRRVIAEDQLSDLLLLEGLPDRSGLSIAKKTPWHEEVRTFTHGAALATYKTTGEMIQDQHVDVMISQIESEAQETACKSAPKFKVVEQSFFGLFTLKICALSVDETVSTAMIVPGSSGGPLVDSHGDLVGVVSAGGDGFGHFVRHKDIIRFLKGY